MNAFGHESSRSSLNKCRMRRLTRQASKSAQNETKSLPRGPKRVQKEPKMQPKSTRDWPEIDIGVLSESPGSYLTTCLAKSIKTLPISAPKRPQERPKGPPNGAKIDQKSIKNRSWGALGVSWEPSDDFFAKSTKKWSILGPQNGARIDHKSIKNSVPLLDWFFDTFLDWKS